MVLLRFFPEANRLARFAVIKADGTGYREIARLDAPVSSCEPSWSWDSRFVIACDLQPDGTKRFVSISVDNGQMGELFRAQTGVGTRPEFSPNGRFIAYGDGRSGRGKVFILPVQGGAPQLVFGNGSFMDWTRDGRYLLVVSRRSGTEGLYLVPTKDGQPAGDPVLLRYGSFFDGHTTANGAFVYQAVPPGGIWKTSVASLNPDGRVREWKELKLSVGGASGPTPSWSPDGGQIGYTATRDDSGQPGSVVIIRDVTSGEEREVYRDREQVFCSWAPHPNLICERTPDAATQKTDIFSVEVNSGRAETLATLPWSGSGMRPNRDGRTFFLFFPTPELGWYTWEIGAPRAVKVKDQGQLPPVLRPSEEWFPRIVNGRELEIRPASGGTWRRLVTLNREAGPQNYPIEYTPDGKWILYGDKDSSGKDSLFRVSANGGTPERIGDLPPGYLQSCTLQLSPDARQILAQAGGGAVPLEFWLLENFEPKPQPGR
jgi:Tol biopolymer transport system component